MTVVYLYSFYQRSTCVFLTAMKSHDVACGPLLLMLHRCFKLCKSSSRADLCSRWPTSLSGADVLLQTHIDQLSSIDPARISLSGADVRLQTQSHSQDLCRMNLGGQKLPDAADFMFAVLQPPSALSPVAVVYCQFDQLWYTSDYALAGH